jgi:hypothetical protein
MRVSVFLSSTAIVAALSGCATSFDTMDKALPSLVGQDISVAAQYLGMPNFQTELMGKRAYVWDNRELMPNFVQTNTNVSGMIGSTPFYGSGTGMSYGGSTQLSCSLRLFTYMDDTIIRTFDYNGNNGACMAFSSRLKALIDEH